MKDSRLWEPVVRQLRHSSPGETAFLTASAECPAPAFGDLGSKGSQRIPVGWDCVVVEEAGDDLLQPFTLFGELSWNLGDDNRLKAAYRGGCRACQNLPKGAIRHVERYHGHPVPSA